jgi:hypothetical protein
MTLDQLSERLTGVRRTGRGLSARCPAHDDRQNSLSLATGDDGRVLVNCFAQCRPEAITRAISLKLRDLFQGARAGQPSHRYETPLDEARRGALEHERAAQRRRERFRQLMDASDDFRMVMREIDAARRVATAAGPESDLVWELLEIAATLERVAYADLGAAAP